jgi:hypothetical protein
MNENLPENFISDPEKILKKARAKLGAPHSQPTTFALGDSTARSLTPMFEVMANKSKREYSAPTPGNIRTGPIVTVGDATFVLKPPLINMVQASQFCGKAHEDANKHLQNFLEICSTFTIKDVPSDAILLCLFPFVPSKLTIGASEAMVLLQQRQIPNLDIVFYCLSGKVLPYRQN